MMVEVTLTDDTFPVELPPPVEEEVAQAEPTPEPSPEPTPAEPTPEDKPTPREPAPRPAKAPTPAPKPAEPKPAEKPAEPKPAEKPAEPTPAVALNTPPTPAPSAAPALSGPTDGLPEGHEGGKGSNPKGTGPADSQGSGDTPAPSDTKPKGPKQTLAGWTSALGQRVQRGLPYPPAAADDGSEGTVTLTLSVSADGALLDAKVARSSGDRRLDEAALRRIRQLAPFSAPPDGAVTFNLPIVFELRT